MPRSEDSSTASPRLIPLAELPPGEGGGKAAGLARLTGLGLSVPPGLVLLDAAAEDVPDRLPSDLETAWRNLTGGTPPTAAVRSSSSGEDGEEASAAGQFATFLDVESQNLEDAVRRCLESAGTRRVEAYARRIGGSGIDGGRNGSGRNGGGGIGAGPAMNVVIQAMVTPSRSGVIFTADPVDGNPDVMVVESVAGLGEALVSGHAEAARYVIQADGSETPVEAGEIPPGSELSVETLDALRAGAALAAADWGRPLDLEWALEGETGEVRWLQARPITALADSLDSRVGDEELITRCNIGEMMPGAVTPLTLSTFGRSLNTGLARYNRSFGALRRREDDPSFIENFEDQLFMNLSSMYLMSRRVLGATAEGTELSILGYVLEPHDVGPQAPTALRFINGVRYAAVLFGWRRQVRRLGRLARRFSIPTEGRRAAEILEDIRRFHPKVMDRAVALHYGASAFSGAMNAALAITLSGGTAVTEEARRLTAELLSGVSGVESAAVLEDLAAVAAALRRSGIREVLEGDDPGVADAALRIDPGSAGEAYRRFMDRHGHRCIREAELREPEWARDPAHLIDSLKAMAAADPPAADQTGTAVSGRPDSAAGTRRTSELPELPAGVNPRAVAWIAKQARIGVRAREKSKSHLIRVIHRFKTAARGMAARLEAEGRLPEADLAYFLTLEELAALASGEERGLAGRAERRRRLYPARMELRFPDLSRGRPRPEVPTISDNGESLRGTPVSRGVAEGPVRVVRSADDACDLEDGEIMVAQFTDVGWTPFYGRLAGMITEIGGALSHGSVVAREYGLPLVGGLSGACARLRTGMRVRIDGGLGLVTILEGEREGEPARVK